MTPRIGAVLTLSMGLLSTTPALAQSDGEWQVCNQTSFILRIATGRMLGGDLAIQGWREALPGQCRSFDVEGEEERYLLAESDPVHMGGVREWKGDVELCAGDMDFEANAEEDCAFQNLGTRRFLRVAGDEQRTFLVEPEDFGSKAETAGLQRLLRDVGQRVRRIDGYKGRGTTRTVRAFLKENDLPANLAGEELVEALRDVAAARQAALGITVCNEGSQRMWAATATQTDGRWSSRGWWPVDPNACVQTSTVSVKGQEPHVFALQEQPAPEPDEDAEPDEEAVQPPDKRLRAVATGPSRFCISEGRFAALGRDQCRDRGYASANFRPLDGESEGVRVTFTDADFVEPSGTGLRR